MDHLLSGVESRKAAMNLIKQMTALLRSDDLNLQKWTSNDPSLRRRQRIRSLRNHAGVHNYNTRTNVTPDHRPFSPEIDKIRSREEANQTPGIIE